MTNRSSCLALVFVFIGMPAVLGFVASSDWWRSIKTDTAASHAKAESTFDPLE